MRLNRPDGGSLWCPNSVGGPLSICSRWPRQLYVCTYITYFLVYTGRLWSFKPTGSRFMECSYRFVLLRFFYFHLKFFFHCCEKTFESQWFWILMGTFAASMSCQTWTRMVCIHQTTQLAKEFTTVQWVSWSNGWSSQQFGIIRTPLTPKRINYLQFMKTSNKRAQHQRQTFFGNHFSTLRWTLERGQRQGIKQDASFKLLLEIESILSSILGHANCSPILLLPF